MLLVSHVKAVSIFFCDFSSNTNPVSFKISKTHAAVVQLCLKVLAVAQSLIFMHFAASAVAGGRKVLLGTFNGLTVLR